jgi:hypothetical protein
MSGSRYPTPVARPRRQPHARRLPRSAATPQYREMACTLGLEYLPTGGPRRFSYVELKASTRDFSDVVC